MEKQKPKAYSYTRMSTPEQLKGDSRRRQEDRAKRYAEDHGLEIVDRFDDFGVSAFKGKNAELGALSEFSRLVDNGTIEAGSYLLVESMDRLTRQTVPKAMNLLLGLTARGICVAILDDNKVYSERSNDEDTFALMSALVSMSRAHDESRRKSGMLAEAWKNKRLLARRDGKVTTSKVPGWLKVKNGQVEEIPERVEIVREIFELTKNGFGAYSIARRLNERNERPWSTRKNAVWRESYIKKIVRSRTVLGEYQPHVMTTVSGRIERTPDGESLKGYYPEIVSLVLYQEANAAVDRRKINGMGRKGARYANLFTGLLRCQCGSGYRYIDKGSPPKGGNYLQCSVSFSKGSCKARAIRYGIFEPMLLGVIDTLDISGVLGESKLPDKLRELKIRKADYSEQERREEMESANILNAIKQGGAGSRLLGAELTRIENSLVSTKIALAQVEREIEDLLRVDPARHRQELHRLLDRMNDAPADQAVDTRRALAGELQRILSKVVVNINERIAWEVAEENPNWKDKYQVGSMAGLDRLCKERSFDLLLVYRSGDTLGVDALDGEFFRSKKSVRMKSLEFRAK